MNKIEAEYVHVPSFHQAGHICEEGYIDPLDHLEYNYDWYNDYYHSIVDKSDIPLIMDQLDRGIPMAYEDLLHFADEDIEIVKCILEKNNFLPDTNNDSSLLIYVGFQQRLRYQNVELGKLLIEHALNCGVTYESMIYFSIDYFDDFDDCLEDYPELEKFPQILEEDEDGMSVDLWGFVSQFKPTKIGNQSLANTV